MQNWKKLGQVFCPDNTLDWMNSHAAVPTAEHLVGDIFRVYFSSRDKTNRSHTGAINIDLSEPENIKVIPNSLNLVIKPGELGEFDDSGAMATWITHYDNKRYLYYIGWNLGVTVPFRNSVGLQISSGEQAFRRYSQGPILDRTKDEPHFVASCCVIPDQDIWRMWYLSCTGWVIENDKPRHSYHIKYAESKDGISWARQGIVAIDYKNDDEYAISRPSVIYHNDKWKMWFSYRGRATDSYRIGYAESKDGVSWERDDKRVGLDVSDAGWDSEMIEYPFVFEYKQRLYMLYNGNNYGETGFGLAVLLEKTK